jgi:hypothetical protein
MTRISDLYDTLFDPFRHNRNRQSSARGRQAGVAYPPTPPSPAAARQRLVMGPGALIRPGGLERLSAADRAASQAFSADAARASRGTTRAPQLPAALRPPAPAFPIGPGGVTSPPPIDTAAAAVGVPREFLQHLVGQESGGDPNARAATSTATGLGQFIEATWLDLIRRYGPRYGAGDLAAKIVKTGSGRSRRYGVDDAQAREEILALRENPEWAALMTAHYAEENAAGLRARLGRNVREGEVYLAHFLGEDTAADLIRAASRETQGRSVSAASIVGREAAQANRNVFYTKQGVARTAREVVELQTRGFRRVLWPTREARQP